MCGVSVFAHRLRLTDDLAVVIFMFWSALGSSVFFVAQKKSGSKPSGVASVCYVVPFSASTSLWVRAGNGKCPSYCSWKSYCSGRLS